MENDSARVLASRHAKLTVSLLLVTFFLALGFGQTPKKIYTYPRRKASLIAMAL